MEDCIFCKIAEGKSPSYKILEDEEHLAFLDIYPIVKGQTLIITKNILIAINLICQMMFILSFFIC